MNDFNGNANGLTDLARITLVYDNFSMMAAAVEELKKIKGFSIVMLKNKYRNPTPVGLGGGLSWK